MFFGESIHLLFAGRSFTVGNPDVSRRQDLGPSCLLHIGARLGTLLPSALVSLVDLIIRERPRGTRHT
jgi:hypothetical protein